MPLWKSTRRRQERRPFSTSRYKKSNMQAVDPCPESKRTATPSQRTEPIAASTTYPRWMEVEEEGAVHHGNSGKHCSPPSVWGTNSTGIYFFTPLPSPSDLLLNTSLHGTMPTTFVYVGESRSQGMRGIDLNSNPQSIPRPGLERAGFLCRRRRVTASRVNSIR